MRIAMISDVHTRWHDLVIPDCDILISAGDYSWRGEKDCVESYHRWLSKQNTPLTISVQGNHELWVEKNWEEAVSMVYAIDPAIQFIKEESFEWRGIKFHCSSITPEFCNWAWNVDRGEKIARHWAAIPDDTQVLITHGPPWGILDTIGGISRMESENLGCKDLLQRLPSLSKLKLHVFGHIHGGSGESRRVMNKESDVPHMVQFMNASICNEDYKPVNPVRIFDLEV